MEIISPEKKFSLDEIPFRRLDGTLNGALCIHIASSDFTAQIGKGINEKAACPGCVARHLSDFDTNT